MTLNRSLLSRCMITGKVVYGSGPNFPDWLNLSQEFWAPWGQGPLGQIWEMLGPATLGNGRGTPPPETCYSPTCIIPNFVDVGQTVWACVGEGDSSMYTRAVWPRPTKFSITHEWKKKLLGDQSLPQCKAAVPLRLKFFQTYYVPMWYDRTTKFWLVTKLGEGQKVSK